MYQTSTATHPCPAPLARRDMTNNTAMDDDDEWCAVAALAVGSRGSAPPAIGGGSK